MERLWGVYVPTCTDHADALLACQLPVNLTAANLSYEVCVCMCVRVCVRVCSGVRVRVCARTRTPITDPAHPQPTPNAFNPKPYYTLNPKP